MRKSLRHGSLRPTHPAEIVVDDIDALGKTKTEVARALGISRNTLYNLLEQKQGVTAEMSLRLAAVFGSTAEFWLNLQMAHDLWQAQQKLDTRKLKRITAEKSAA